MSRRSLATTTLTAGAAAALLLLGPSSVAAAPAHHRTFTAVATGQLTTGPHSFVLAEQDLVGTRVVGNDVLTCRSTPTHSTCEVAIARAHGLLYGRFVLRDADHSLHGEITGGAGRYRRAHGHISGTALSPTAVRVTLSWRS